jgi:hypothetical protein
MSPLGDFCTQPRTCIAAGGHSLVAEGSLRCLSEGSGSSVGSGTSRRTYISSIASLLLLRTNLKIWGFGVLGFWGFGGWRRSQIIQRDKQTVLLRYCSRTCPFSKESAKSKNGVYGGAQHR